MAVTGIALTLQVTEHINSVTKALITNLFISWSDPTLEPISFRKFFHLYSKTAIPDPEKIISQTCSIAMP